MPTTPSTLTNMPVERLTEAKLTGKGVFDVLMQSVKLHLEQEYNQNRIRGTEYSQVYLGSMTAILEQSTRFLLDKDKSFYEIALVEAQVRLADAQVRLVEKQIEREDQESELRAAQVDKIRREILTMDLTDAGVTAQTAKIEQDTANAVLQGVLLELQQSQLNSQIRLSDAQKTSTDAQSALVIQKTLTEKAQIEAGGVDENSVLGKQKNLYQAQTNGFLRDAEQKAARTMIDTWNARRTTDEGTVADATNRLDDATIGKAVEKLLAGVGISL